MTYPSEHRGGYLDPMQGAPARSNFWPDPPDPAFSSRSPPWQPDIFLLEQPRPSIGPGKLWQHHWAGFLGRPARWGRPDAYACKYVCMHACMHAYIHTYMHMHQACPNGLACQGTQPNDVATICRARWRAEAVPIKKYQAAKEGICSRKPDRGDLAKNWTGLARPA